MDDLPLDQLPSMDDMQQQQAQAAAMDEQRMNILEQILEPAAKDRLLRLSMVKKEKARRVEDSLIRAATSGQLRSKVTEEQLIELLDKVNEDDAASGVKKVTIQRRRFMGDDDDDDDDSDLL